MDGFGKGKGQGLGKLQELAGTKRAELTPDESSKITMRFVFVFRFPFNWRQALT